MKNSNHGVGSVSKLSVSRRCSRLLWRTAAGALALTAIAALAQTAAQTAAQATPPALIEVHAGDTFSAISARYTGDLRTWRKLYSPELTGLANPNLIAVGQQFELVTDTVGKRYLRLVSAHGAHTSVAPAVPATVSHNAAEATPRAARAPTAPVAPAVVAPVVAPAAVAAAPASVAAPAAAVAAVSPPVVVPAAPDSVLVIGVLPNIAAATLTQQYESLKHYLERSKGQKVRVVVPANFKDFFDNMMKGDYDLAVAAPHFARVAQLDRNMIPLVIYEPRINALFIASIDGKVTGPRDIQGKAIAFANPSSLVAMFGQQWLRQQNLVAGRDYEVKAARTDLGVGRMLLTGDAVAAIMSNGEFRGIPADEAARVKIVEVFARIPNFIVMAHPRLDRDRIGRLRTQFKEFLADTEDGAAFARATGFSGMFEVDEAQLRELDAFAAPTRRAMGFGK